MLYAVEAVKSKNQHQVQQLLKKSPSNQQSM